MKKRKNQMFMIQYWQVWYVKKIEIFVGSDSAFEKIVPKSARRKVSGFMTAVAGMAIKKACSIKKECELFL